MRVAVLLVGVAAGSAAGQVTSRVSVDSGGEQGDDGSYSCCVSADGRFVAFVSDATDLVGGDTNGAADVFVHDRQSGRTDRVSVDSSGAQGNGRSGVVPAISADGRYVAFESFASNLVAGDSNGIWDVFVHDRQTGATERVSIHSNGAQGTGESVYPSISADGRYVSFSSWASNLVAGDSNGYPDVFVHDRQTGTTERVSVASSGIQGDEESHNPSISADGQYVSFESQASNLVSGDTNHAFDVFVHDRLSGTTERVSVETSGAEGNGNSYAPAISSDGRYVAFTSYASNLVVGDMNFAFDVFVHDRLSGMTELVSVDSSGVQGNGESAYASISADGRYVALTSHATNLVVGDTNDSYDVFVHDRQTHETERVSVDSDGSQGNYHSVAASISADGRYVAFESLATYLVDGDTNGASDIFVRDRSSGIGWKYCTANANSTGSPADLSASGSASSGAGDLVLTSSPVPDQDGIFFHGANQSQVPFGNGFLCATGSIVRGAVVMGVGNVATYTYANSDTQHSLAAFIGSTRNFQHWFRDPSGGGAFFNTSNAISIPILP
jgi:Tol biopolymer transport system component